MWTRKILAPLCLMVPLAWGQAGDEPKDPPALSGPRVKAPDDQPTQAFMPDEQRLAQRRAAEARALPRLLRQMSGPRADASIRLSPAQQRGVRSIRDRVEAKLGEYLASHREQLITDLRVLGVERVAASLDADKAPAAREIMEILERVPRDLLARTATDQRLPQTDRRAVFRSLEENQREALLRILQIQREAPKGHEVQDEILAELNEAQRTRVEQQFARLHDSQMREAREQRMAQEMRDTDAATGEAMTQMDVGERDGPDRLDRLIAELLPSEREVLADLIERRLLGRLQNRGRDKPAPLMEDVELPPPTKNPG